MDKRDCGSCHLFVSDEPGGFTGKCKYFPPQLVRIAGELVAMRAPTTRDDSCHIGWRPHDVRPTIVSLDPEQVQQLLHEVRS